MLDPLLYDPADELLDERLEPPLASYFLMSALEAVMYQAGLPRSPKAPSEQPDTMAVQMTNITSLNLITIALAYNNAGLCYQ